jgi:transcriptional regulator with XRE-family HTH domain
MTQTELAARLGVRERTITRWESASLPSHPQPSTRYLLRLCEELDCSLMWLMTGEPDGEGVAA